MQKALIYCRVSTEEQAEKGYSLDAQEKFCRNYAKNNGYEVLAVYRDEGKSATSFNRPALQDLLSKCQQDQSIDALIVQETDRLARNTKDHLTIKAVLKKVEVKVISVAQPMLDDSPEGMMIDTILASVNQFQSDINSRKTKKGLQERFNEGWYPGWAPLGYINVPVENSTERKAKKIIKQDPSRWHLIKEGFKLYLTGNYSVNEINDFLYQKGLRSKTGKKVPHSIMTNTLKNPFYAGLMSWNGQEKTGKHQPMISLGEHQHVLQIMDAHNLHACRRRKHSFLLRGFIFCNICGQRYTAEKHTKRKKEYYHCAAPKRKHSNQGQNIEVEKLEKQIEDQFESIQFSQKFIDQLMEKLRQFYYQQKEVVDSEKQILFNQKKAIEAKRDKIEEKLLNGVLSDEDFVRLKTKFKEGLAGIQSRIDELDWQKEHDISVVQEVIKLSHNIYKAYKTAPYELKRQYLGLFWDKFLVQDKKIVEAVPTKIIRSLAKKRDVIISHDWLGFYAEVKGFIKKYKDSL
jgi:DNA invertase Pin-like site-specific DNA recombinase/uncharacterized Zn finger protein (UPF0148 family)